MVSPGFDFGGARGLLGVWSGLGGAGVCEELQLFAGDVAGAKTCRAEEDDCVLNALAPETGLGLEVLRHDADHAPVGRVEEVGVFVGERGVFERHWIAFGDVAAAGKFNFFGHLLVPGLHPHAVYARESR